MCNKALAISAIFTLFWGTALAAPVRVTCPATVTCSNTDPNSCEHFNGFRPYLTQLYKVDPTAVYKFSVAMAAPNIHPFYSASLGNCNYVSTKNPKDILWYANIKTLADVKKPGNDWIIRVDASYATCNNANACPFIAYAP